MAKRYPVSRIKTHRSYEVDEAADLLGCTPQTVRHWIREGLPAITDWRPYLILGRHLKPFLEAREAARKRPLGPNEFWCVSCKTARKSALGIIEEVALPDGRPLLKGICGNCDGTLTRFVRAG